MLSGPAALEGGEIVSARIEDVAPTVLYLLGEPIPVELEGRLLVEAIEPYVLDERPPDYDDEVEAPRSSPSQDPTRSATACGSRVHRVE